MRMSEQAKTFQEYEVAQLDPYRPRKQHSGTIERIIRDFWKGETG